MVDYSKWDLLDDEDDDLPPKSAAAPPQPPLASFEERQANHGESTRIIAEWAREADPRLSEDDLRQLMRFITVQHRGVHPDNTPRHVEIVAFMEKAAAEGKAPANLHSLLALGHLCGSKSEGAEQVVAAQANRMLDVVMCAINTLRAAEVAGGPRPLFDKLLKERDSPLAARYRLLEFAAEVVQQPPLDPRDAPPEPWISQGTSWFSRLVRVAGLQCGISLLMMVLTMAIVVVIDPSSLLVPPVLQAWLGVAQAPPSLPLADGLRQEALQEGLDPSWFEVDAK